MLLWPDLDFPFFSRGELTASARCINRNEGWRPKSQQSSRAYKLSSNFNVFKSSTSDVIWRLIFYSTVWAQHALKEVKYDVRKQHQQPTSIGIAEDVAISVGTNILNERTHLHCTEGTVQPNTNGSKKKKKKKTRESYYYIQQQQYMYDITGKQTERQRQSLQTKSQSIPMHTLPVILLFSSLFSFLTNSLDRPTFAFEG